MAAVGGDAASMVAVGLVWGATNALMRRGATNALMRRGALVWDRRSRSLPAGTGAVRRWADLLLTWQYSAPFLANPSASAAFFRLLGDAPISVAVPVTNATTFAATAVAAALLGEATRAAPAALGTALIVLGVWAERAYFSGLDRELGNVVFHVASKHRLMMPSTNDIRLRSDLGNGHFVTGLTMATCACPSRFGVLVNKNAVHTFAGPYLNALFWSSHDTVPGYS
ncbi:hypothetical protein ACQJBY_039107 [Aegilops geniculata]